MFTDVEGRAVEESDEECHSDVAAEDDEESIRGGPPIATTEEELEKGETSNVVGAVDNVCYLILVKYAHTSLCRYSPIKKNPQRTLKYE